MKVLIVEDDLELASALRYTLEMNGVIVEAVRSVSDAMNRVLRINFDLAILDLFVLDGATVSFSNFMKIRSPKMPIISITGSTCFANGDHNEAMSSDYLIRKPISPTEVVDIAFYLINQSLARTPRGETQGAAVQCA